MKARSVSIYGVLAAVGLIAAYLTWQRPKETVKSDTVTVLDATKQSLDKVHYDNGSRFLEVTRRTEPEPRLWVTMGFLPGQEPVVDAGMPSPSVDGGVDGGAMALTPPVQPPPTRTVKANERGDTLFARFTPFTALRALGVLPEAKLDELGLSNSPRRLELTIAGTPRRFIASKPVSGIIGAYIEDEQTKDVYLLQSTLFSELDPDSQLLIDRRLHTFKQSEFDAFTVSVEGLKAEFVQSNAEIPATAKVAKKATPDKPEEMAKNWHDKIWNRVIVTDVLGEGELPKPGEPKVLMRLDYTQRGTPKGWLEVAVDSAGGSWARSENTASWVAVHQGSEELVLEAKKIAAP